MFKLLFFFMLIASCQKSESPLPKITETKSEKVSIDSSTHSDAIVDKSVSGITIGNPESALQVIGADILKKKQFLFLNQTATESLEIIFHPGDQENAFSEFKLKTVVGEVSGHKLEKIDHFKTGKGISLGMSFNEVEELVGESGTLLQEGNLTRLEYQLTSMEKSNFLKEMNMPSYFSHYIFEDGKLTEIYWGLENP